MRLCVPHRTTVACTQTLAIMRPLLGWSFYCPVQAFEPLSAQLSDPPKASPDCLTDTYTLDFQVPHKHQHQQSKLGILTMAVLGKVASLVQN